MSEREKYQTLGFKSLLNTAISGVDKIEIPMIQRDYAYGRKKEREKRKDFLEKLKSYLEDDEIHELDFVYGNIDKKSTEKILILLDGQQRITTLFLLHWYLAVTADNEKNKYYDNFKKLLLINSESRFTYKTRPSSSAFCNALVKLEREVTKIKKETKEEEKAIIHLEKEYKKFLETLENVPENSTHSSLSAKIMDDKWFHPDWQYDPTVNSMLNMLDSIYEIFKSSNADFYYKKLFDKEQIAFNFFNLNNTGLTDDLYIKMNSRGKPLTPFENLKSKILYLYDSEEIKNKDSIKNYLNYINNQNGNSFATFRDFFSFRIDTRWTDIFWNRALEKNKSPENINIDSSLLNFIETVCVLYRIIYLMEYRKERDTLQAQKKDSDNNEENDSDSNVELRMLESKIQKLEDCVNPEKISTYSEYVNILTEKNNHTKEDYYLLSELPKLFEFFTTEKDNKFVLNTPIENFYIKESEIIDNITTDKSRESKALFFAYILYVLNNPNYDKTLFTNWLRVISNIVNNSNTIRNNETSFINAIEGIFKLYDSDITKSIVNVNVKSIDTLDQNQINEEIIKIKLSANPKWKKLIDEAELSLPYFSGHLSYALKYSKCVPFSEADLTNTEKQQAFEFCIKKLQFVFSNKNGCNQENDLIKALLSKCNESEKYLLELSSNFSFCRNNDRDISWIKLLDSENSEYFTRVIKDADFSGKDLKEALKSVYSKRPESIEKWKKIIIDNDKINNYIKSKRCIRFNNAEIDLLPGTRITGYHSELYSLNIFLQINDKNFGKGTPGYHVSNIQSDKPYCFVSFKKNEKTFELSCKTEKESCGIISYLIEFYEAENAKKSCRTVKKAVSIPEIHSCLLDRQSFLEEDKGIFSAIFEEKNVINVINSIADLVSTVI